MIWEKFLMQMPLLRKTLSIYNENKLNLKFKMWNKSHKFHVQFMFESDPAILVMRMGNYRQDCSIWEMGEDIRRFCVRRCMWAHEHLHRYVQKRSSTKSFKMQYALDIWPFVISLTSEKIWLSSSKGKIYDQTIISSHETCQPNKSHKTCWIDDPTNRQNWILRVLFVVQLMVHRWYDDFSCHSSIFPFNIKHSIVCRITFINSYRIRSEN